MTMNGWSMVVPSSTFTQHASPDIDPTTGYCLPEKELYLMC